MGAYNCKQVAHGCRQEACGCRRGAARRGWCPPPASPARASARARARSGPRPAGPAAAPRHVPWQAAGTRASCRCQSVRGRANHAPPARPARPATAQAWGARSRGAASRAPSAWVASCRPATAPVEGSAPQQGRRWRSRAQSRRRRRGCSCLVARSGRLACAAPARAVAGTCAAPRSPPRRAAARPPLARTARRGRTGAVSPRHPPQICLLSE